MRRLLIHVEGQTEETFVDEVLAPYLYRRGYSFVSARLIGNSRIRNRRGGSRAWTAVRKELLNHLNEDPSCLTTIMVDYYRMRSSGPNAWPGRHDAARMAFEQRAVTVENALKNDLLEAGGDDNVRRFVPYVAMHEFEGMLFSDCTKFADGIGHPNLAPEFQAIRDRFDSPEAINDSEETAPSRRIAGLLPEYDKPFHGVLAALRVGIDRIIAECPHFREWMRRLDLLAGNA